MLSVNTTEKIELNTLVERLRQMMPRILATHPIMLAYLYGSVAEDATTPFSDVDIALVAARPLSAGEMLNVELEVQNELRHQAGIRNADVRLVNPASLLFQGQVVSRGILLYTRDDAFRISFETRTRLEYLDFKPIEEQVLEALFPPGNQGGTMLDRHKILRMLQQQREYLKHLRTLAQMDVEQFVADPHCIGSARYYLLVAIEVCIDVGNHIIAGKKFRSPTDYADIFRILGENRVIPQNFVPTLEKMAGFRNLLVHVYMQVNDRQVHENLQTRLSDFEQFQNYVLQFLEHE
jgi:uncharacterized protein YutE (UPF0331/DUF86 family)/predicted nucleotidyltransferase